MKYVLLRLTGRITLSTGDSRRGEIHRVKKIAVTSQRVRRQIPIRENQTNINYYCTCSYMYIWKSCGTVETNSVLSYVQRAQIWRQLERFELHVLDVVAAQIQRRQLVELSQRRKI